jgi:hypothetical protein
MSKNRANYVAAKERFSEETRAAPSREDNAALAYQLWISRGREDGAAVEAWFDEEPELGFANAKSTTA